MPVLLLIRHGTNNWVKEGRLPGQAPNLHLNDDGRAQAEALSRLLEKQPISAIYSSHLERAIETAYILARPRELPVHIRRSLADTDTGDYTAKTIKEISEAEGSKENWKTIVEKPSEARLPNGESLLEMQARVVAELERICAAYPDPEPPKDKGKGGGAEAGHSAPGTAHSSPNGAKADVGQANNPPPDAEAKKVERKEGPGDAQTVSPPQPPPPTIVAVVMHADPIKAALAHFLGMPFDNFQRLGTSPASISTVMVHGNQIMVLNVNRIAPQ